MGDSTDRVTHSLLCPDLEVGQQQPVAVEDTGNVSTDMSERDHDLEGARDEDEDDGIGTYDPEL